MGFLDDRYKAATEASPDVAPETMPKNFAGSPGVFMALSGHRPKGEIKSAPGSITIWWGGKCYKMSIKFKKDGIVGFVDLDPTKPLGEAIEAALYDPAIGWRKETDQGLKRLPRG